MLRSLYCVSLVVLLLVPPGANAEIHIALHCRVKNRPPGRCGWCSLETLARHHGLKALYGLADRHPCTCSSRSLENALQELGVPYRIQYPGIRSRSILHFAIDEKLGAAVGLRAATPYEEHGVGDHIVTLVDLTPEMVLFIDPNDVDGRTRSMSLHRFFARWDGLAVVLVPDGTWVKRSHPWRSRETTATMRRAASSMSCWVNNGLRLKRIAECRTSSLTLIACSTGEGSSEPLEQAEPVEQAMPAKSKFINSRSAFIPGNDTLIVCGMPVGPASRRSSGPLRTMGPALLRS